MLQPLSNKIKKIAIVSDAIYPYNKGGKEKRIYEISTRLAKRGYQVIVYTMKWWEGEATKRENGLILKAISPLYPLYSGERRSIKEAIFFGLNCFKLISEDFDILDADHMPHLVLFPLKIVCVFKRKKFLASWNEVWGKDYWISYMGKMGVLGAFIEKISSYLPDKIISISSHTTNLFKILLNKNVKVITVPCGINFNEFLNIKKDKESSDLIFAGRLLSHKNVNVLIDSVKILKKEFPNILCLIIGDGPEKAVLIKQIELNNLNNNIKVYSFFDDHKKLFQLIKSSKIFVFPSTREGFGLVVLEANALGIPVITTNDPSNAAKDLISNGVNGYSINLNPKIFAKKATYLLKHSLNKEKIVAIAKKYDWNLIVNQIIDAYKL